MNPVSKKKHVVFGIIVCMLVYIITFSATATTRYVDINNPTPQSPYTNWSTAATVIQNALDVCSDGDIVIVEKGVYATGVAGVSELSRISISNGVSVISLHGPEQTIIVGSGPVGPSAVRGAKLNHNAFLSGFTVSNGHTAVDKDGGGIYSFGVVSNCIVCCNASDSNGGGIYGGGIYGSIYNSIIYNNRSSRYGGGVSDANLFNSTVFGNVAYAQGGGYWSQNHTIVSNCIIYANIATNQGGGLRIFRPNVIDSTICNNMAHQGGGVYIYEEGTLSRCIIRENAGYYTDDAISLGGGVYCHSGGEINNCLIINNKAEILHEGGNGGGVYIYLDGIIRNSTIVQNGYADNGGGGVYQNSRSGI
jgi:hypothetical protein